MMRLVYQSQQITASKRKSISPVMKIHLFLVLALMGFSITSVLAQEGPGDGGDSKVALSEAETSINFKPSRNYRLKGGDEVQLIVYEEEELNKTTTLTPTGEATFLLIESINLNGLTLAEAGKKIENAFKPDYLKKPKVTLDLITAAAERVSVNGAVVSKGDVAISPGGTLDILGALLRAGGLSKEADKSKIIVTRGKDRQTYHYDALSERGADPVLLMNHDSIDVGVHPHAQHICPCHRRSPQSNGHPLPSRRTTNSRHCPRPLRRPKSYSSPLGHHHPTRRKNLRPLLWIQNEARSWRRPQSPTQSLHRKICHCHRAS